MFTQFSNLLFLGRVSLRVSHHFFIFILGDINETELIISTLSITPWVFLSLGNTHAYIYELSWHGLNDSWSFGGSFYALFTRGEGATRVTLGERNLLCVLACACVCVFVCGGMGGK